MTQHVPKLSTVTPGSEVGRLLEDATDAPLLLEKNGGRFRVIREEADPWAGYDPEAVRTGLRAAAGMITPEEGERLKDLIYRGREEGTRPLNRP